MAAEALRQSAYAQLGRRRFGATKILIDMLKDIEKKAGMAPPPETSLTPADEEVIEQFVARLPCQIATEAADKWG
jgi:hypothetical protein